MGLNQHLCDGQTDTGLADALNERAFGPKMTEENSG
jgi:hypothetical protein